MGSARGEVAAQSFTINRSSFFQAVLWRCQAMVAGS
jgi:hypothetical protein